MTDRLLFPTPLTNELTHAMFFNTGVHAFDLQQSSKHSDADEFEIALAPG